MTGWPVVVTSVGGLPESANGYGGAVLVPPGDPAMLREGLMKAGTMAGQKFPDPRSWHDTVAAIRLAASVDRDEHAPGK